jgi:hypothetical protein
VTETTLDFYPQGVLIEGTRVTTKAYGFTDVQDFVASPPALVFPAGAKPGDQLQFDMSGSGTTLHVVVRFTGTDRLTIAGQPVDTLRLHETATLSGKLRGTRDVDEWVLPEHDLIVKSHTVQDVSAYGSQSHSDVTSTLRTLTPS